MKKIFYVSVISAIICLLSCESEQEISSTQVPPSVMSAFQAKYPNVTPEKWVKEKEKGKAVYEVKFKNNNKEVEAEFEENGTFIEEE